MQTQTEYPKTLFKSGEAKEIKNNGEEAWARQQGFTEPYKHQEYPKQLYKGGTREVHPLSGDQVRATERVVKNEGEEKAARADGFFMLGEPVPEDDVEDDAVGAKAKGKNAK